MAEIAEGGGGGQGGGKKRAKKSSTRVDMTPMVDLAFLLLTFFVLTSTFAEPKIMGLAYPAKIDDMPPEKQPKVNNGITFLLSKDRVFYYKGELLPTTILEEATFEKDGVRKLLADNNKSVIKRKAELDLQVQRKQIPDSVAQKELIKAQKDKKALKVLIKTDTKATCKNFIDLIDELKIANVGVVAPVDLTLDEEKLIKAKL